jgi:hypothetical protein
MGAFIFCLCMCVRTRRVFTHLYRKTGTADVHEDEILEDNEDEQRYLMFCDKQLDVLTLS